MKANRIVQGWKNVVLPNGRRQGSEVSASSAGLEAMGRRDILEEKLNVIDRASCSLLGQPEELIKRLELICG
jgi:hypothetical protein